MSTSLAEHNGRVGELARFLARHDGIDPDEEIVAVGHVPLQSSLGPIWPVRGPRYRAWQGYRVRAEAILEFLASAERRG